MEDYIEHKLPKDITKEHISQIFLRDQIFIQTLKNLKIVKIICLVLKKPIKLKKIKMLILKAQIYIKQYPRKFAETFKSTLRDLLKELTQEHHRF